MAGTLCGSPMYMVSLVCLCHSVRVCVCMNVTSHNSFHLVIYIKSCFVTVALVPVSLSLCVCV